MKQLISQEKIDAAAYEYGDQTVGNSYVKYQSDCAFKSGVEFALKEIEPFIIELLNWQADNYIDSIASIDGNPIQMWKNVDSLNEITTKQLLEEFINSKNNGDETD